MPKYQVIIEVDENKVKEMAEDDNVISAIERELGWTEQSGIYVESVEEKKVVKEGYFEITSIHRNDLRHGLNFTFTEEEIAKLTDEDMQGIASQMAEAYCDGQFWNDLEYFTKEVLGEKE